MVLDRTISFDHFRQILCGQCTTTVLLADALGIDATRRLLRSHNGLDVPSDDLILATETRHLYVGHPAWEALASG